MFAENTHIVKGCITEYTGIQLIYIYVQTYVCTHVMFIVKTYQTTSIDLTWLKTMA